MDVQFTPKLRAFVQGLLASKKYSSIEEIIDKALRLLQKSERDDEQKLKILRRKLTDAIDDADRGESEDLDEGTLDRIRAEGLKRLYEERIATLKSAIASRKSQIEKGGGENWIEKVARSLKDFPEFDEVVRLGHAYRSGEHG